MKEKKLKTLRKWTIYYIYNFCKKKIITSKNSRLTIQVQFQIFLRRTEVSVEMSDSVIFVLGLKDKICSLKPIAKLTGVYSDISNSFYWFVICFKLLWDELSIVKAVFLDTDAVQLWAWQLGNHNVTSVRSNPWLIQDWDKHAYMTYINETFVYIKNSLEMFRTFLL